MADEQKKSPVLIIVIVIVVLGIAIGVYFAMSGGEEITNTNVATNSSSTNTNQTATNTATDPYADLMQYDDKTIDITSADGKVTGQIAISIDKTQEMPITVVYFMRVDDALPQTIAATGGGASYYYIASHAQEADLRAGDGTGSLGAAFCNVDQIPDVLALAQQRSIDVDLYLGCDAQYEVGNSTETFYHIYSSYFNNYTWDYNNDVIGKDKLAVFDTAPFYEEEDFEGVQSWGADNETVIRDGEVMSQYDLIFTE
ncbi:MAG: hypothetical protein ABIB97_02710 [Patescibacteria group bacterium]